MASGDAGGYLVFTAPQGDIAYVKWLVRAVFVPGQGGKLGRSAGSSVQVVAKEGDRVTLRLPSSEMRMVRAECRATIGTLSNSEHQNVVVGKAGQFSNVKKLLRDGPGGLYELGARWPYPPGWP